MDARTALKKYNETMIKTYGFDYTEHWSPDDKATFEILASNARKEVANRQRSIRPNTSFLRVFMAGKRDPEYANEQAKILAWNELVAKSGTGVVGKLAPKSGLYDGAQPKKRRIKREAAPVAPTIAADDVDSSNIMAYLLGK